MTDKIDALLARLGRAAIKMESEDWNADASAIDEATATIRSLRAQRAAGDQFIASIAELVPLSECIEANSTLGTLIGWVRRQRDQAAEAKSLRAQLAAAAEREGKLRDALAPFADHGVFRSWCAEMEDTYLVSIPLKLLRAARSAAGTGDQS